ncbi:hypothetical protein VNI00_004328 [Paramarasmius palmivorus]|uniref:Uncharacterized protein n=1 Tax=Paramarasmius palmivorus TaxID=297713 RepID=A0AAW0DRE2_9AGAR
MNPLPYNVTLSSQSATLIYAPFRDATIDLGWNVTYSGGVRNTEGPNVPGPQGVGTPYRRTTNAGASVELRWIGTAIYLYGNATSGSYSITVDGSAIDDLPSGRDGLLGTKTGLAYSNHSVILTAVGGIEISFWYADVTIGVGYPNASVKMKTIPTVNQGPDPSLFTANSFFTYRPGEDSEWLVGAPFRTVLKPGQQEPEDLTPIHEMVTNKTGDSVTFTINSTSAFFLWSTVASDHGAKTVTLTPTSGGPSKTTALDNRSSFLDFKQILYWESNLDRDQTYMVEVVLVKDDFLGVNHLGVASLDLMDGGSTPSSSTTTGPTESASEDENNGSNDLSKGSIAGIAVGVILGAVLLGIAIWMWRRRRRSDSQDANFAAVPFTEGPEATTSPFRAVDGGPILPPEYDERWTGSSGTASTSPARRALPSPPLQPKRL